MTPDDPLDCPGCTCLDAMQCAGCKQHIGRCECDQRRAEQQAVNRVEELKRKRTEQSQRDFERGFACACADLWRQHGEPGYVQDLIRGALPTRESAIAAEVDASDLEALDAADAWRTK